MNLKAVTEGLLFVSGSEGITLDELSKILEIDLEQVQTYLKELKQSYQQEDRGITLEKYGDVFKLTTKKEHKPYYEKLVTVQDSPNLSQAALETLAIIAYNEPITRVEVDEIRGVGSAHLVRKLLLKNLIEERGKSDLPGRPMLYGTTKEFLDFFGLKDKSSLPIIDTDEIETIEVETDLFDSKYHEKNDKWWQKQFVSVFFINKIRYLY